MTRLNSQAKLTLAQVRSIRLRHAHGQPASELARMFRVTSVTINLLVRGETWPDAEGPIREKHALQQRRDRKLIRLWAQDIPTAMIARQLGYGDASAVRHAARRLGLPAKQPNRNMAAVVAANAARLARKCDAIVRQVDQMLKQEGTDSVEARWWRCGICDGRSSDRAGHELCRNRLAVNELSAAA